MRLEADKIDPSFYAEQSIQRNIPITVGIGSPQIDRNSIGDIKAAKHEIQEYAQSNVSAVKQVCENIDLDPDNWIQDPWPSHVYFEDVNGESQFDLVEIILNEVANGGVFERRDGQDSSRPDSAPSEVNRQTSGSETSAPALG